MNTYQGLKPGDPAQLPLGFGVSINMNTYPSFVTFRNQQVLDKPFHPEE